MATSHSNKHQNMAPHKLLCVPQPPGTTHIWLLGNHFSFQTMSFHCAVWGCLVFTMAVLIVDNDRTVCHAITTKVHNSEAAGSNPMMFLTPSAPASRARGCPITSSSAQLQHPPLGVSDSSQHSLEPALFGSITLRSFLTWPQSYRLLFYWRLGVSLTKRSSFNKKQCNKIARTTDRRRAQNTHAAHTRIIGKARSDKT